MLKIHVHPYEMHGFSVVWRCPLTLVLLQLSVSTTFEINSATVHTWSIASNFATASHTGTCAPQPPGLPPMPGASETVHRVCLGSRLNPDPRHRSREQVLPCLGQRARGALRGCGCSLPEPDAGHGGGRFSPLMVGKPGGIRGRSVWCPASVSVVEEVKEDVKKGIRGTLRKEGGQENSQPPAPLLGNR